MVNPLDYPHFVFVFCLLTFWISALIGRSSFRKRQEDSDDFASVLGSTLTLLGLIIGFTLSTAVSRFDQRKNYEEQEANAIGTEYVRVGLLPAADVAKVYALLEVISISASSITRPATNNNFGRSMPKPLDYRVRCGPRSKRSPPRNRHL
jgi:NhaP-type Na+/H+ or K+/H+ antiporter